MVKNIKFVYVKEQKTMFNGNKEYRMNLKLTI